MRIDLDGTKPPIWRRLLLGSDLRLDRVHEAIQIAFDWDGHHLHEFSTHGDRWTAERFVPADRVEGAGETAETAVRLDQVLTEPGDRLRYTYDFGDDWEHTLRLEEILPREPGAARARLLAGRRAAPPDDCGGVYGYAELLSVLADPSPPEHAERSEWFEGYAGRTSAGEFDPAGLDVTEMDEWLPEEVA
jgi:peptidoglycan/xylan/chitin deacetylase (PgdA/CDA1 family)